MDSVENFLNRANKPVLIYFIFMLALITYDISQVNFRAVGKNLMFLITGVILLGVLCYAGFDTVAWILLALPPFFFVALVAMFIVSQIINTNVNYDDCGNKIINGNSIRKFFGIGDNSGLIKVGGSIDELGPDECGNRPEYREYVEPQGPRFDKCDKVVIDKPKPTPVCVTCAQEPVCT